MDPQGSPGNRSTPRGRRREREKKRKTLQAEIQKDHPSRTHPSPNPETNKERREQGRDIKPGPDTNTFPVRSGDRQLYLLLVILFQASSGSAILLGGTAALGGDLSLGGLPALKVF